MEITHQAFENVHMNHLGAFKKLCAQGLRLKISINLEWGPGICLV